MNTSYCLCGGSRAPLHYTRLISSNCLIVQLGVYHVKGIRLECNTPSAHVHVHIYMMCVHCVYNTCAHLHDVCTVSCDDYHLLAWVSTFNSNCLHKHSESSIRFLLMNYSRGMLTTQESAHELFTRHAHPLGSDALVDVHVSNPTCHFSVTIQNYTVAGSWQGGGAVEAR